MIKEEKYKGGFWYVVAIAAGVLLMILGARENATDKKNTNTKIITPKTLQPDASTVMGIPYQAVAKTIDGMVIRNQKIGVWITIIADSATGKVLGSKYYPVSTNQFGLFCLDIGDIELSGGADKLFIRTDIQTPGGATTISMLQQ